MVRPSFIAPCLPSSSSYRGPACARVSPRLAPLLRHAEQRKQWRPRVSASAAEEPKETPRPLVDGPALSLRVLVAEFIFTFILAHLNVVNASCALGAAASASSNGAVIAALATAGMMISGGIDMRALFLYLWRADRAAPVL